MRKYLVTLSAPGCAFSLVFATFAAAHASASRWTRDGVLFTASIKEVVNAN